MIDPGKCGSCGARTVAMIEMAPGRDGQIWHLCGKCYADPKTASTPPKSGK